MGLEFTRDFGESSVSVLDEMMGVGYQRSMCTTERVECLSVYLETLRTY